MNLHRTVRAAIGAALAVSSLAAVSLVAAAGRRLGVRQHELLALGAAQPRDDEHHLLGGDDLGQRDRASRSSSRHFNSSQTKVHVTDVNQTGGYVADLGRLPAPRSGPRASPTS